MNQITKDAVHAFMEGEYFSRTNTEVICTPVSVSLYLHNNPIARRFKDGSVIISTAGFFSHTTRARLNAIPGVSIVQRDYRWYLNGVEWDGDWIKTKELNFNWRNL